MNPSTQVPICQARVGACGYALSCQALNVTASQGPRFRGTCPMLENPSAWLPEARARAEPGLEDKVD
jgi:hypothetical protein